MYNILALTACLAPLLGFRQPPKESVDEPQLTAPLLIGEGQVAMQNVHPLLTVRNIFLAAPQLPVDDQEDSGAAFSAYLTQLRTAAVSKVLEAFMARKKLTTQAKTVAQDAPLTGQSGEFARKIIKQGRFVGFALQPLASNDLAVRVTGVGTQFSEPAPDFKLYLFHSTKPDAVAEYPLPRTSRVYFEWSDITIELPTGYEGGEWCLGYFEDDLPGQAVDLQHDFGKRPGSCCGRDYLLYDQWAPLVQVRGFSVPEAWAEPGQWTGIVSYVPNTNFGLNLRLSAACDLSGYFCRNKELFTSALRLQLAVDLLSTMAYTTRNNGVSGDVQTLALTELNNRPDYQPGLLSKLDKALGALDVDLSGVSRTCLPCKTNGVSWGAIG